jgi:hypothetical protein
MLGIDSFSEDGAMSLNGLFTKGKMKNHFRLRSRTRFVLSKRVDFKRNFFFE